MLHIFTDGACSRNGLKGAKAAYSLVIWNKEPLGMAYKVPEEEPQTNQRAELRGVNLAFEEIKKRQIQTPITIWSDSQYACNCVQTWGPQWKVREWKRTNGSKPLEHLDLLKPMIDFYELSKHFIILRHVKAHTNIKEFPYTGNAMADKLATELLLDSYK
jgi:ribonuclease HI